MSASSPQTVSSSVYAGGCAYPFIFLSFSVFCSLFFCLFDTSFPHDASCLLNQQGMGACQGSVCAESTRGE